MSNVAGFGYHLILVISRCRSGRIRFSWTSGIKGKVWINQNETLSKIENSIINTHNFDPIKLVFQHSWDGYFDKVSYGLTKNYGYCTIFNFPECLIFYDSDFTLIFLCQFISLNFEFGITLSIVQWSQKILARSHFFHLSFHRFFQFSQKAHRITKCFIYHMKDLKSGY